MKKLMILIIFFVTLSVSTFALFFDQGEIISIRKSEEVIKKLRTRPFDILWEKDDRIYIHVSSSDIQYLLEDGIDFDLESDKFDTDVSRYPQDQTGGINGPYHTYHELEQDLLILEENYPSLAKIEIIGSSLEQRNLYAMKISDNVQSDENESEVILIGCHHAREWISVEVTFLIAKHLLENYAQDPSVKNIVDQSEIWIVPLLNPDGLEYSIYFYRYWRKNRSNNGDGTYGVDLNRNYGYQWGIDDSGSSGDTDSAVYRGPAPFSEPETQAIRQFFDQRDFQALISYHSYSQVILYPWGYTEEISPDAALMSSLAENMSRLMLPVNNRVYEFGQAGEDLYLTNGDTTDWAYGIYGMPAYTLELPPVDVQSGGFFNAEEDILPVFRENLPAALYLIEWTIENYNDSNSNGNRIFKRSPGANFSKKIIKN